jgi:PAS domain S-box-containing protein
VSAVILVVDDNPANLKLACDLLECEGHEVLRADGAERALEILERRRPDLILMDLSMPGMDGLTLTRRLKADPRTRDLVVVALTASAMSGDEDRVMAAGCDGYISKPIDTRVFPEQVAGFCRAPERSKQILVVDDSPTNRKLLCAILEADGLTVVEAGDGVEALEVLNRQHVDAIVSDILMPRMDGYRLCYEVRSNERLRRLPFVIYTSTYTSPGDEKLALDMGADRYLTKPAPASAILEAVQFGTRRGPGPAPRPARQPELVLMKEYSQQLVTKLEERNAELAQLTSDLGLANEKLLYLLAHSPAVIYELKLENGAVLPQIVSENVTALLGFTSAEACSYEWWLGQLHPEDRQRAVDDLAESVAQTRSRSEYRICHKDGAYRWVEDNRRLVRDAAGAAQELMGVWTDITERKQMELELQVRDQRLNAFFSNATAGLCILDRELRFVQLNETLAAINGIPRGDHLGKTMADVLPTMNNVLEPILSRVLSTGESVLNVEVVGQLPGSPQFSHWIASYFPVNDESGRLDGLGAVGGVVTERRNAEQALRGSEAKVRQFAEHVPEVFWMRTPDMSSIL